MDRLLLPLVAAVTSAMLGGCGGRVSDLESVSAGVGGKPVLAGTVASSTVYAQGGTGAANTTSAPSDSAGDPLNSTPSVVPAGGTWNGATMPEGGTMHVGGAATGGTSSSESVTSGGTEPNGSSLTAGTAPVGGSTATSTAAGGSAPIPEPICNEDLNLLSGDLGPDGNWIGGAPKSNVPRPCGVHGQIYIMGDLGLDGLPMTGDETCPFMDQSVSPCVNGRCCVRGTTHLWPRTADNKIDRSGSLWGCGIGISLNDPSDGNGTRPYEGPARGFTIHTSSRIEVPGEFRISYTQMAEPSTSPFQTRSVAGNIRKVLFSDVACPTRREWGSDVDTAGCVSPGQHPHALQFWAVGGEAGGDFDFCLEELHPVL